MPLLSDNQVIGVLSVLSDETQAWPELIGQFRTVIAEVVVLIIVAFGVPVVLYMRKLTPARAGAPAAPAHGSA